MKMAYYDYEDNVGTFKMEALRWLQAKTPFRENNMSICHGVDCVRLQYAIHKFAGAVGKIDLPRVRMDHHWHNEESMLENFLKSLNSEKIFLEEIAMDDPWLTGDLVTISWGRCAHHLASYFGFEKVLHVAYGGTVSWVDLSDERIKDKINKRYRFYIS